MLRNARQQTNRAGDYLKDLNEVDHSVEALSNRETPPIWDNAYIFQMKDDEHKLQDFIKNAEKDQQRLKQQPGKEDEYDRLMEMVGYAEYLLNALRGRFIPALNLEYLESIEYELVNLREYRDRMNDLPEKDELMEALTLLAKAYYEVVFK